MASRVSIFFAELKRRKVYRVAAIYGAVGVAISLGVPDLFGVLLLPDWAARLVIALIAVGFPVALVLAWAYEVKPEEPSPAGPSEEEPPPTPEATAPTERPTTRPRRSIVVLPFDNMSPDPGDAYLAEGLTEEIIADLSYIRALRVISRNSAMVLKGTQKSTQAIAEELDVQYVLEGSVRKAGNDLRITAQLIDAGADEHLWAESYDRALEDVFAVQSDVAEKIARALRAELTPGERERLHRKPTENLVAYELCLRGLHVGESVHLEALKQAGEYFREAIALDPGYARAYAGLAEMLVLRAYLGDVPPDELFPQMREAANEAMRLDPGCGEAHVALAIAAFWYEWDWAKVDRELETALKLNPDDPWAHGVKGFTLFLRERFAEAEVALRRAIRLDPLSALRNTELAEIYACTGRPEEGIAILDPVLRRNPQAFGARMWRGLCHLYSGDLGAAASDFDESISIVGRLPAPVAFRGIVHAFSDETERARQIFQELCARAPEEYVDPYYLFVLCHALDGFDAAFPYMERALDVRSINVGYFRVAPRFRELRSDPRFLRALRTIWPDDFQG